MARPAKSINTSTQKISTADKTARKAIEQAVRGPADKVTPPDYLSRPQAEIFTYIVDELKASGILGNLDVFILAQCSIAIDSLQRIARDIIDEPELFYSNNVQAARAKYSADLYRCCSELSLSPQSRAKIGAIRVEKAKSDPLLDLLKQAAEARNKAAGR